MYFCRSSLVGFKISPSSMKAIPGSKRSFLGAPGLNPSHTKCNIALEEGPPEKANKTFSPALITRAFPIVARNLCVKYARKHGLQRGSFNRTTTTAWLRKHFIHVRQPPKFSLTGLFSRRVETFSKSSFS